MKPRWWVLAECSFTNGYATWWQWMGCCYPNETMARYAAGTWGSVQVVRNVTVVEPQP